MCGGAHDKSDNGVTSPVVPARRRRRQRPGAAPRHAHNTHTRRRLTETECEDRESPLPSSSLGSNALAASSSAVTVSLAPTRLRRRLNSDWPAAGVWWFISCTVRLCLMSAVKLHIEQWKLPVPPWFFIWRSKFHLYGVRKSHIVHFIIGIEWYLTCFVNLALMWVT